MAEFKVGDKVRVIKNCNSHMKSYVGKHGKVTGGLTPNSCRVKLAYDDEVTFDNRELELDGKVYNDTEESTAKPTRKRATRRGK